MMDLFDASQQSNERPSSDGRADLEPGCLDMLKTAPTNPTRSVCSDEEHAQREIALEEEATIMENGTTSHDETTSPATSTLPTLSVQHPQLTSTNMAISASWTTAMREAPVEASCAADQRKSERAVKRARLYFLLALSTTAVALGVAGFCLLSHTEQELSSEQFEAVARRALYSTQANTLRKRMGSMGLANTVGSANPDDSAYPQVFLPYFERMAGDIIEARNGRHMAFAPLIYNVTQAKLQTFEDFAYDYYAERFPFDPNAGMKAVEGRGVWTRETTDGMSHKVIDSSTVWGGKHSVAAPKLQHDSGNDPLLMTDFYKIRTYGESIDKMIDCAATRREQGNLNLECGVVSEMFLSHEGINSPISRIFAPVYPSQDPFYLGGFVASTIVWDKVLEGVFDESIRGVDCVLKTATGRATYHIQDGKAVFFDYSPQDQPLVLHSYEVFDSKEGKSIVLTGEGHFAESSPPYKLTITHTDEFDEVYATNNPLYAAIVAMLAIVLTSLGFVAYDKLVNRDIRLKKQMFLTGWLHRKRFEDDREEQKLTRIKEEMFLLGWNERKRVEAIESEAVRRKSLEEIQESLRQDNRVLSLERHATV